jgi:phospholipid/cholesterol/gamma-HCH transport system substrate-binding protein
MQKQAPTLGRLLVMVGFALSCFGLLLFLWLAFGGPVPMKPKGYRFATSFGEATQLAKEADVRISGVSVGKVKQIETEPDGRSKAVIELDQQYAPLPKDARATLRQKTLLGETYVELAPGHRQAGFIKEGGTLPASQVSSTVELDEIFRAFDAKTRAAFETWMQSQAQALAGRGQDVNDALGNLAPFADDANRLLTILNSQEGAVRQLVRNTGTVFDALSERDHQLASLITNSNRVFSTTGARDRQLREIFHILPTFETESKATVERLSAYAKKTNPLITQLRPAARELSPTLTDLSALAPDAKALFRDLEPLIRASKQGLPATQAFLDELHPLLAQFDPVLRQLNPILSFVGAYKDELNAFFANTVAATQATSAPTPSGDKVHYLRTMNPLNPENLAVYPRRIGSNRTNPYELPDAFRKLAEGLPQFETRHCGNGVPTVADDILGAASLVTPQLIQRIREFAYGTTGSGKVAAPPCKQQGPFTPATPGVSNTGLFPQVAAASSGSSPRAAGSTQPTK